MERNMVWGVQRGQGNWGLEEAEELNVFNPYLILFRW
jgi:hypothetical protein